jgi:hypothetical protein
MKLLVLAVIVSAITSPAIGAPEVAYVGLGRYACSGRSSECAQVDINNRIVSEVQRRQYQDEQDRVQAYVEKSRRDEKKNLEQRKRQQSDAY